MKKREKYAIGQHDLACDDLSIGKSPDDPGPTLHEAVCDLREAADLLLKGDIPAALTYARYARNRAT